MKAYLILLMTLVVAMQPVKAVSDVQTLNVDNGLSSNFVKCLYKDSKGFIWIGTENGLERYDGTRLQSYRKRFREPLKGGIRSMLENPDGSLWIGTEQGAFLFNRFDNSMVYANFGKPAINIRTIARGANNDLLFASDLGLFRQDSNAITPTRVYPKATSTPRVVYDVMVDSSNKTWFTTAEGLHQFQEKKTALFFPFPQRCSLSSSNLLIESKNILYVGTEKGIFQFDLRHAQFTENILLSGKSVLSLASDGKNTLLAGTVDHGVFLLDTDHAEVNTLAPDLLLSRSVYALLLDNEGIVWTGTFTEGVHYFLLNSRPTFKEYAITKNGVPRLRSLCFNDKNIIIGSNEGILLFNPATQQLKRPVGSTSKQFTSSTLTTIHPHPAQKGQYLVGTFNGGLYLYDDLTQRIWSYLPQLNEQTIYKMSTDKNGNLWMVTLKGLYHYDIREHHLQHYDPTSLLGTNELFSLLLDRSGNIWVGSKNGACYFSNDRKQFIQPSVLKNYRFQCPSIYQDSRGDLWFCFNKGGVLNLSEQLSLKHWITVPIGLPENAPSSIIEDTQGNLWIGSQKGMYRLAKSGEIRKFSPSDGLTGQIICPESASMDSQGVLWWINNKGLLSYDGKQVEQNLHIPVIVLTTLDINGETYDPDTLDWVTSDVSGNYRIRIRGNNNDNITFSFAAMGFTDSKNNHFSYLLEGQDTSWRLPETSGRIHFEQLKTGNYRLFIKASNNDGVWVEQPMEIDFSIVPYFYETLAFLIFLVIGLLTGVFYFNRLNIHRMKKRITEQIDDSRNKKSNTRTRVLSDVKILSIQESLSSYMSEQNPWLNPGLKESDVAEKTGFTLHEISLVLNNQLGQNFSDYINTFRLEEVRKRVDAGELKLYTLTAIALSSGFNSKTSFYRACVKLIGKSPSEHFN